MFIENDNKKDNVGWICPLCGRSNSPKVTVCPCTDKVKNEQSKESNIDKNVILLESE